MLAPRAALMDRARHQLLAHPRLAQYQHVRVGRGHHLDLLAYAVQSGTAPEKLGVARSLSHLLAQIRILRLQALSHHLEQLNPLTDIAPVKDYTRRIGRILQSLANSLDVYG